MAHARTLIRDLLAARVTGLPTVAANVFKNRVKPLPESALPAISVSSGDEQINAITQGSPRRLSRIVQVHFDIIGDADADGAADTIDTVCEEIEGVLIAGAWSAGQIFEIVPASITEIFDGDGNKIIAQTRLTYEVEYHTAEGAADLIA